MSVPQFARFIHLLVCILALKTVAVFAGAAAPEMKYGWKPGEVYRYDYAKTISITEASTDADPGTREFKFEGVLILEVNGKVSNGVKAVLRFDSPKMVLPDGFWFSPQADDPVVMKEKTKSIARAMETAIKLARWSVTLDFDGTMHIDSRMPKSLDEWQKEVKDAGNWKGKYRKDWVALVEENLGLVASGDDRELLLGISPPPVAAVSEMTKIRPYRAAPALVSSQDERAEYSFKRMAPPQAGQAYAIPNMPVTMTFNPAVKTTKGAVVFDTKLNILDTLSEEYSFEADYATNAKPVYTLHQQVTVKYELTRRSKHKPPDEVDAR